MVDDMMVTVDVANSECMCTAIAVGVAGVVGAKVIAAVNTHSAQIK